jgi:predicted amidohydrolase
MAIPDSSGLKTPRAAPTAPLTIAAGQARCVSLDIPANVATASELVRQAAAQGADLLLLPELFLTGYELEAIAAEPRRYALERDDSRLDPLAAVCAATRTAVLVGMVATDSDTEALHISALVLGRDGGFIARYDKQHVDADEEAAGFSAGKGRCTITLDGWRLGLAICRDSSFPDHARAAALDGCHAYLICALFPGERGERGRSILCPARAMDNAMYVAAANHCSPSGHLTGCGRSAIWDPEGMVLAEADVSQPGVVAACFHPDALATVAHSRYRAVEGAQQDVE